MVSAFTLAELSNQAYSNQPSQFGQFAPLLAYVPIENDNQNGFSATTFQNISDPNQVVIAVRGTDNGNLYTSALNWIANFSIASNVTANSVIASEVTDLTNLLASVHQNNPTASIVLTGHSLGGALAQIVGNAANIDVVSFDAPGAAGLQFDQPTETLLSALQGLNILSPTIASLSPGIDSTSTNFRLYGDQVSFVGTQFASTTTETVDNQVPDSLVNPSLLTPLGWWTNHDLGVLAGQLSDLCINTGASASCANLRDGAVGLDETKFIAIPVGAAVTETYTRLNLLGSAGVDLTNWAAQKGEDLTQSILATFENINVTANDPVPLDPLPGYGYIFDLQPGSPYIASVNLPDFGPVQSWELEFEDQSGWSAPFFSDGYFDFSTDVSDLFFVPLDAQGNPVYNPNPFLLDISFQSDGIVNADLHTLGASAVPEPETFALYSAGLVGAGLLRRRKAKISQPRLRETKTRRLRAEESQITSGCLGLFGDGLLPIP